MIGQTCRRCGSTQLRKHGRTASGHQKFPCKVCNFYGTLDTQTTVRVQRKKLAAQLQFERLSQRAIARSLKMSRCTVAGVWKKQLTLPIGETMTPVRKHPILEFDELWSCVGHKGNVVWVWLVLDRQTRRIVGLAFGERSRATCRTLWASLPADYRKRGICYSDFWQAYTAVLPSKRHRSIGKETGQTAHIERFNLTLRQRYPNLVCKTLSFSKDPFWHEVRIRHFIDHYNQTKSV